MLGFPHKLPRGILERPTQPEHHIQAGIALPALHETNVGRVALGLLSQLLVGQFGVLAEPAENIAEESC